MHSSNMGWIPERRDVLQKKRDPLQKYEEKYERIKCKKMEQSQEMREKIKRQYDDNAEKKFTNVSFFSLFRKNKF